MSKIKVAELSTLNCLEARELAKVVGGTVWKPPVVQKHLSYTSIDVKLTSYEKSFIHQNANNNSSILQGGHGLVNVANVHQSATNAIV